MSEQANTRLNSWKEIAEYLQREVRTVARWEKEFGLPVHRVGGGKGRSVFAYTREIDAWLERGIPKDSQVVSVDPVPHETPLLPNLQPSQEPRRFFSKWLLLAVASVLVSVVLLWTSNAAGSDIARVRLLEGNLTAYDADHKPLWTTAFDNDGIGLLPAPLDLNGDGRKEVVAFRAGGSFSGGIKPDGGELTAFSGNGDRLWSFKPGLVLKFGDQEYGGPWPGNAWTVVNSVPPTFALAVHHYTWWPGVVNTLDSSGRVLGVFVNSGWITSLASIEQGAKARILAGGINNGKDSAILAVLDPLLPSATSPEAPGSEYECTSCSPGKPVGYFVFPRSELNRSSLSKYNQVIAIEPLSDRILVHVQEVDPGRINAPSIAEAIYEFGPDLQPRGVRFSDQYWALHRHLEKEGMLHHGRDTCPERMRPRVIQTWSQQSGWQDLSIPPL
jgi:Fe-S-cluster formation regulator IscX/YfhJ